MKLKVRTHETKRTVERNAGGHGVTGVKCFKTGNYCADCVFEGCQQKLTATPN